MTELPLVFLGGLLGSSHCIGMCGPLALALGVKQSIHTKLLGDTRSRRFHRRRLAR